MQLHLVLSDMETAYFNNPLVLQKTHKCKKCHMAIKYGLFIIRLRLCKQYTLSGQFIRYTNPFMKMVRSYSESHGRGLLYKAGKQAFSYCFD